MIVCFDKTLPWNIGNADDVTVDALTSDLGTLAEIDILLIGCGPSFTIPPKQIRAALKEQGVVLEWMDTGAVDTWRVYALEWLPDQIRWFIDGELIKIHRHTDYRDCLKRPIETIVKSRRWDFVFLDTAPNINTPTSAAYRQVP